jgi:hypothetical protein
MSIRKEKAASERGAAFFVFAPVQKGLVLEFSNEIYFCAARSECNSCIFQSQSFGTLIAIS